MNGLAFFLRRWADRRDPLAPVTVGAAEDVFAVAERVNAALVAAGVTLSVNVLPEVKQPPPGAIAITRKTTRRRTAAKTPA